MPSRAAAPANEGVLRSARRRNVAFSSSGNEVTAWRRSHARSSGASSWTASWRVSWASRSTSWRMRGSSASQVLSEGITMGEAANLLLRGSGQHEQVEELDDWAHVSPSFRARATWSATSPRSMAAWKWCARANCWATLAGRRTGAGLGRASTRRMVPAA